MNSGGEGQGDKKTGDEAKKTENTEKGGVPVPSSPNKNSNVSGDLVRTITSTDARGESRKEEEQQGEAVVFESKRKSANKNVKKKSFCCRCVFGCVTFFFSLVIR